MNDSIENKKGNLFIVATPIGNLEDITLRAIFVLKQVDLIAAEDTRHSKILFQKYEINTPTVSLYEYNEEKKSHWLCEQLQAGKQIALISDAGTPLISDPGYRLVQLVKKEGISIISVPGPCAAITALVSSGLPTDRFVFEGFLSKTQSARRKRIEFLKTDTRTIILYEAAHHILNLLKHLAEILEADRQIVVARELTKKFETIYTGTSKKVLEELSLHLNHQKGEFVVMIEGRKAEKTLPPLVLNCLQTLFAHGLALNPAVKITAEITGARRKQVYDLALPIWGKTV